MRITFVLNHVNLNGGIRVIAIYAERLKQRGHHVTIVSRPRPVPTLREQARSLLKGGRWIPHPRNLADHFDNVDVEQRVIESRRPIVDRDVPPGNAAPLAARYATAAPDLLPAVRRRCAAKSSTAFRNRRSCSTALAREHPSIPSLRAPNVM